MQNVQHQKLRAVIDEHLRSRFHQEPALARCAALSLVEPPGGRTSGTDQSANVYGKVRSFVRDFLSEEKGVALDEDKLLSALHEKKVVEELLGSLGSENERLLLRPRAGAGSKAPGPTRGGLFLHVRVGKGSSFLDPLMDAGTLVAHFFMQGQRHATRPCVATSEPDFDDGLLFQLHASDRAALKTLNDQLHVVVVQHSPDDSVNVVGTQRVEWRKVLLSGILSMVVELSGLGGDTSMPVGAIGLQLELLPRPPTALCSEDQVRSQVRSERDAEGDADRRFFAAAKIWWKEFLQIRPEHSTRAVKIFARTETDVSTPVCSFVQPLEAGRALRSAGEAARFVSLLEFERMQTLGGTGGARSEVWSDLHTVLVSRKGDVEEHAALLCSLLLGFRLDAYCALGTTVSGEAHMWVLTLERHDPALPPSVTFWEPLTGSRYLHKSGDAAPSHKYGRVGCVFNHSAFYANIHGDDAVRAAAFDLDNFAHWKAMDPALVAALPRRRIPPLVHFPLATHNMEEAVEASLRQLITSHRSANGLATHWDPNLSFLLSPALLSYETGRITGSTAGATDFQQSIRNSVPEGYSFKGFPIQFAHLAPARMMGDLLRARVAAEMIDIQGGVDSVRFALRALVSAYPERVCSVWVMIAVIYAKVDD